MKKTIQILILFLAIGFNSFAQTVDLQKGLIAYYPFNGNANDESGNLHNGIVLGATLTSDKHGSSNSAYYFDGKGGHIKVPNAPELNLSGSFSFACWSLKENDNNYAFISKGRDVNAGSFNFSQHKLGITYSYGNYSSATGSSLPNDEWHYIVGILDNGKNEIRLYQDGILVDAKTASPFNINNDYPLVFGRHYLYGTGGTSWQFPWQGKLDEIRIYNRALNEAEIQALYNYKNIVASNITNKNRTNESNVNETISKHTVVSYSNCYSALTALNSKSKLPVFENFHLTVTKKNGKPYKKVEIFIDGQNLAITNNFGRFDTTLNKNSNLKLLFKKGGKQFSKTINFSKDSIYTFKLKLHKPKYTTFSIDSKDLETPIYEKIKSTNSISLFNSFVSRFPKGKYNTDIMRKIETIWYYTTINQNCTDLYEKFISKYPNDKYTDKVKVAFDDKLFSDAEYYNSITSYKNYLKNSPLVSHKKEAEEKAFNIVQNQNTEEAYSNYINIFGNSFYKNDAENNLKLLVQKRLKNEKEETELFRKAIEDNDALKLYSYINKYPDGKYKEKILSKIKNKFNGKMYPDTLKTIGYIDYKYNSGKKQKDPLIGFITAFQGAIGLGDEVSINSKQDGFVVKCGVIFNDIYGGVFFKDGNKYIVKTKTDSTIYYSLDKTLAVVYKNVLTEQYNRENVNNENINYKINSITLAAKEEGKYGREINAILNIIPIDCHPIYILYNMEKQNYKIQYSEKTYNTLIGSITAAYENEQNKKKLEEKIVNKIKKQHSIDACDEYLNNTDNLITGYYYTEIRTLKENILEEQRQARERLIQINSNKLKWKLGDNICYIDNSSYIMAQIDQWNSDKSKFKIKIVASPGVDKTFSGNSLEKGNTFWIKAKGWHKCLDDEKEIALNNDKSKVEKYVSSLPSYSNSKYSNWNVGDQVRFLRTWQVRVNDFFTDGLFGLHSENRSETLEGTILSFNSTKTKFTILITKPGELYGKYYYLKDVISIYPNSNWSHY